MKLTFQWFGFSSPQMHAALDIRTKVFVDEQGYTLEDDRDEQDKTALHVLGMTRPVCRCARRACLKKGPACGTLAGWPPAPHSAARAMPGL